MLMYSKTNIIYIIISSGIKECSLYFLQSENYKYFCTERKEWFCVNEKPKFSLDVLNCWPYFPP